MSTVGLLETDGLHFAGLEELPVVYLSQLERDTVLVCYERTFTLLSRDSFI